MRIRILLVCCLALLSTATARAATTVEVLEQHLQAGNLPAAEAAMNAILKQKPQDAQAQYGLGSVQFLRAVEGLAQDVHRYGFLQTSAVAGAGLALGTAIPVPQNPNPEELDYPKLRQIYQKLISQLERAEANLALVTAVDVKLPLHFGLIRLDLNGDGKADDGETLWKIYAKMNAGAGVGEEAAKQFVIAFDAGDVQWLRGYCHLLMAIGESTLAYDFQQFFEGTGHLLVAKPVTPYPFLKKRESKEFLSFDSIIDFVATIHLMNFPVAEPKRMTVALQHLESMVHVSTKSWDLIVAETDNDNEWIPNSKQDAVIPNIRVTEEMIASWKEFLAEASSILKGETLIPFWRTGEERGVNLRQVFLKPRQFDIVLWIHGTGAAPYLEQGKVTSPDVWNRLNRVFGGQFIGFALWFN
jgi:hypothetical protein